MICVCQMADTNASAALDSDLVILTYTRCQYWKAYSSASYHPRHPMLLLHPSNEINDSFYCRATHPANACFGQGTQRLLYWYLLQ